MGKLLSQILARRLEGFTKVITIEELVHWDVWLIMLKVTSKHRNSLWIVSLAINSLHDFHR